MGIQPNPPRFASRCRHDSPLPCIDRYKAMRTGPGIWKAEGQGWMWVQNGRIEDGLTHCPYCLFPLPQTDTIIKNLPPAPEPWRSDPWPNPDE